MLREHSIVVSYVSKAVDLLITASSFVVAYWVSGVLAPYLFLQDLLPLSSYLWMLLVIVPAWAFTLSFSGFYTSLRTVSFAAIVTRLTYALFLGALICAASVFIFKQYNFSRGYFGTFIVINYTALLVWKMVIKKLQSVFRTRGYNFRQILIVGNRERANRIREILESHKEWALKVKGVVDFDRDKQMLCGHVSGMDVCVPLYDFREMVSNNVVDEVVLCLEKEDMRHAEQMVQNCEEMGITARFVLDIFDLTISRTAITRLEDYYLLTLHTISLDRDQAIFKRTLDIVVSLIGLLITAILLIPVAIAIRMDSKGSVFFKQKRVGQNGRLFRIYKFRTMYTNAEDRKEELMNKNKMSGAIFKMENDPRITRVGRFLRKYSIDELPQFFNVFRGDMSLVGTRPPLQDEVKQYTASQRRRLSIRPGLTGMWQVSGRGTVEDFDRIVEQDLAYIDQWTLGMDIRIILRTVWILLKGRGE